MKAKKYSSGKEVSKRNEHLIKEDGGRYARQMSYKAARSVGINLTQAKKRLRSRPREPRKRSGGPWGSWVLAKGRKIFPRICGYTCGVKNERAGFCRCIRMGGYYQQDGSSSRRSPSNLPSFAPITDPIDNIHLDCLRGLDYC